MTQKGIFQRIKKDWVIYLMLFPAILYFVIFNVIPIIGMKLAFQDYRVIGDNIWVGLKHFKVLFDSPAFLMYYKIRLLLVR